MSHHMTMGRQLVGRALTTRRAPRSSSHARGPLGTIVRAWVRQQQAQSVMCKAHRALHTNTSRHRRASDPCCCSRAFAPDPLLPLAVSTQLPRPRRQRQAATTVELQQLVATVRTQLRQQLYRHFFQHDDGRTPAPAPPSRWRSRRPSFCGRSRRHPVASHHPPHPPRTRERSRPPRGAWLSSSWGLIVDCNK